MTVIPNPKFLVAKQYEYREPFWGAVDQLLPEMSLIDRRVVILDTGKALETAYLLKLGYIPSHIHVVNHNSSHIAWITMRNWHVHTYRDKLVPAIDYIRESGPIDVVNYDGMGVVGTKEFSSTILQTAVLLDPGAVLGVTLTGSREVSAREYIYRSRNRTIAGWQKLLPEYSSSDHNRFDYLITLCNFAGKTVKKMKVSRYRSRHLDMLWAAMLLGEGKQRTPKFL